MLTEKILERATPSNLIIWPPTRARTMRTSRANTVPPGAAMEPRLRSSQLKNSRILVFIFWILPFFCCLEKPIQLNFLTNCESSFKQIYLQFGKLLSGNAEYATSEVWERERWGVFKEWENIICGKMCFFLGGKSPFTKSGHKIYFWYKKKYLIH